jgi:hypothetical protein
LKIRLPSQKCFLTGKADDEAFADEQELQDFLSLLMRHWNSIGRKLDEDDVFSSADVAAASPNQNERAVVTNFGRAERLGTATSLDLPISENLRPEERRSEARLACCEICTGLARLPGGFPAPPCACPLPDLVLDYHPPRPAPPKPRKKSMMWPTRFRKVWATGFGVNEPG